MKQRKLSVWRVILAIVMMPVIVYGGFTGVQWWQSHQTIAASNKPWFAAYVDVTATPSYPFQQMGTSANKDAILSFIVSLPSDACIPSWGGAYTLSQASSQLDLDTRIARLQQQGGSIAISFGGRNNQELSVGCTDMTKLSNAYQAVVNEYNINTIDLDIEGSALTNTDSQVRRAITIAKLQSARVHDGKKLAVWVTLPVTPQGLSEDGTNALSLLLENNVDIAGVNAMTMDYGTSYTSGLTMLSASQGALIQTQHQLGVLYQRQGLYLNDAALWAKMGATPMIGQNDDANEIFTLEDAQGLNMFAHERGMSRMSMWSANRDITCGTNYVNIQVSSDACSGINEDKTTFTSVLSAGFDGNITLSAGMQTKASQQTAQLPDNPAQSPYQIWSITGAYLANTKVVWHHNIYIAKWWTQGDIPDNPVLQSWQTPWQLIGPVLPGQTPIPRPTLPSGTYANWSGNTTYNAGDRVLLNGIPFQAKWWNQAESPEAAASDPNGSPWVQLSQDQINQILKSTGK